MPNIISLSAKRSIIVSVDFEGIIEIWSNFGSRFVFCEVSDTHIQRPVSYSYCLFYSIDGETNFLGYQNLAAASDGTNHFHYRINPCEKIVYCQTKRIESSD